MAQLPLLFFPTPQTANRTTLSGGTGNVHTPDAGRQWARLSPMFKQLQSSFNQDAVQIQSTPVGIDPEQVIVLEIVGNIENFVNAVIRIPGLEWLGETEVDEIVPDSDFYIKGKQDKKISGRLYLIMSNQVALEQMLSLWARYQKNPSMKFPYRQTKFRNVFLQLKNIRKWGVEDRLEDKQVFEAWQEDLEADPHKNVRFEVELWYRESKSKRAESAAIVSELIRKHGGNVISQCSISSIAYHSILGEIPAQQAQNIINQPEVDLLKCNNIMFIRPSGQMATGKEPLEGELSDCNTSVGGLPSGDPVIAVLDGLPLENHELLSERLIVDDPEGWAAEYPAYDRQHGTAMASLIIHGDLSDGSAPLDKPVYVLPVMKPIAWSDSPRPEESPHDQLFVDYIHRAVKRMMDGDGEQKATAPTIKIINLSIGDSTRPFLQFVSPLARLLDWLSEKYKILFVISAGNHLEPIETNMTSKEFESLSANEREKLIVSKLYEDTRNRKLLSPAESINGLTVGALHQDNSQIGNISHLLDVFESTLPSPISAFGFGHRKSVKPDLLYSGGKVLYRQLFDSGNTKLQPSDRNSAPGNKVATPGPKAGLLAESKFSSGSSNATALISRFAGNIYDYLSLIFDEQALNIDFKTFGVPLLKALIVHGCSWSEAGDKLDDLLKTKGNKKQRKGWISRWLGFGIPDVTKSLGCNEQRATLLGFEKLKDGEAHVYSLPLPPSLNAQRTWRKVTVTLAWLSPIASTTQKYRGAQLWFDFGGSQSREKLKRKLHVTGQDNDGNTTRRGTLQHEVFEGISSVAISDGDTLQIKVNCRKDAQKITTPVTYGLVVSLEVAESTALPIYNEIQTRIATLYDEIQKRITPRVGIRPKGQP